VLYPFCFCWFLYFDKWEWEERWSACFIFCLLWETFLMDVNLLLLFIFSNLHQIKHIKIQFDSNFSRNNLGKINCAFNKFRSKCCEILMRDCERSAFTFHHREWKMACQKQTTFVGSNLLLFVVDVTVRHFWVLWILTSGIFRCCFLISPRKMWWRIVVWVGSGWRCVGSWGIFPVRLQKMSTNRKWWWRRSCCVLGIVCIKKHMHWLIGQTHSSSPFLDDLLDWSTNQMSQQKPKPDRSMRWGIAAVVVCWWWWSKFEVRKMELMSFRRSVLFEKRQTPSADQIHQQTHKTKKPSSSSSDDRQIASLWLVVVCWFWPVGVWCDFDPRPCVFPEFCWWKNRSKKHDDPSQKQQQDFHCLLIIICIVDEIVGPVCPDLVALFKHGPVCQCVSCFPAFYWFGDDFNSICFFEFILDDCDCGCCGCGIHRKCSISIPHHLFAIFKFCSATKTHSAVLETCGGWRLNRLPGKICSFVWWDLFISQNKIIFTFHIFQIFSEIKKFIQEDAPKYPPQQLKVVYIGGVDPRLIFLDETGQQLERLEISTMSRDTVRGVLAEHGLVQMIQ